MGENAGNGPDGGGRLLIHGQLCGHAAVPTCQDMLVYRADVQRDQRAAERPRKQLRSRVAGKGVSLDSYVQTGCAVLPTHYLVDQNGAVQLITQDGVNWALQDLQSGG